MAVVSDRPPAAAAVRRVSAAGLALGLLGLATTLFVLIRLFESWRVGPGPVSHHITVLGQRLGYPTANVDAIVIVGLALLAVVASALAAGGAAHELLIARRLRRWLSSRTRRELDGALVIADERPLAFCFGFWHPAIYISTGVIELLDRDALSAVLEHERHHATRRDPLRFAAGRVLARSLFFLPGLDALVRRHDALAELSADESAVDAAPENRSALARAMLSFSDANAAGHSVGFDPARVEYLLGEPPSLAFPVLRFLAAALVIALLVAVAAVAGHAASGSATLAPPFLSSQPCIVVLATLPALAAVLAVRVGRKLRR